MKSWIFALSPLLTRPSLRVCGPVWYFKLFETSSILCLTELLWADSDCTRSPNTAHQCSIPTVKKMFTSDNLNELSTRNSQDLYTSSKRIDLRKVTFGEAKLRPFTMSSKRRVSLPTHTRPVSYPANEEQSLPQPSQPSIHDTPGWLFTLEGYLVVSMLVKTNLIFCLSQRPWGFLEMMTRRWDLPKLTLPQCSESLSLTIPLSKFPRINHSHSIHLTLREQVLSLIFSTILRPSHPQIWAFHRRQPREVI